MIHSSLLKNSVAGCSKRSQRRDARRSMSGGVLSLYVDAKSVECNEAYESFSAVCNLAVGLDTIAVCHRAHRHSDRVPRMANPPLAVDDDQPPGAAGLFCEQNNSLVCCGSRIRSSFQKFKGRFRHHDAHNRFAVAGARNAAQLISVGSTAKQGRVPYSPRKFLEDSPGGSRYCDPPRAVQGNTADGTVFFFPAFSFGFDNQ